METQPCSMLRHRPQLCTRIYEKTTTTVARDAYIYHQEEFKDRTGGTQKKTKEIKIKQEQEEVPALEKKVVDESKLVIKRRRLI